MAVVRSKVKSATDGDVTATWGTGVSKSSIFVERVTELYCLIKTWMALAAAVLLWVASVSSCCGVFTGRRRQAYVVVPIHYRFIPS